MTNEEMQRAMEFIVEHQAQFAASIQELQEERRLDSSRLKKLEESFPILVQVAEKTNLRVDRLEDSLELLVRLAESTNIRLERLENLSS